ncbi:D-aminoacylase [Salinifilum aidingensis]
MSEHDIAVNGGVLVDGTGRARRRGNLGITAGRIAEIGPRRLRGAREIDATGLVVAPGFIDLHTHADFTVEESPAALPQLRQGVTTLITGNCGHSPFPVGDLGLLRRASIFDDRPLSWDWRDARGFRAAVDRARPAVNIGVQVGHNAIRLAVLGEQDREPDPAELERMRACVRAAAAGGALGFSTGLIYAPGVFAPDWEVAALVETAAAHGLLYSTHLRDEAAGLLGALDEAVVAARRSGARLQVSHLKAAGPENHGSVTEALARLDSARAGGVDAAADVYPYTASSTSLLTALPPWAVDGGSGPLLERLADAEQRRRIAAETRRRFGRDLDPHGLVLAEAPAGRYSAHVGSSVVEIARCEGTDAAEAVLRVLQAHRGEVLVVHHSMHADDVRAVLRHPRVAVASDGWTLAERGEGHPHPRSFGTFARVLGWYVRDEGLLGLEEAVRKMTELPATRLRLAGRGVLATGAVGDVTVFDPAAIHDRARYERPRQGATGCRAVVVNGEPVIVDGDTTGRRPGRVLGRDDRES